MNLIKIIEKQKLLDSAIKEAHSINQDHTDKMLIALYTEVGEFANEVQSFKYWKKTKIINKENLLEEYADGIHFLMSFVIKMNCSLEINSLVLSDNINVQFLEMFNSINELAKDFSKENVERTVAIYLGLAKILNIDDKTIEREYFKKNKKNFERLKNNY